MINVDDTKVVMAKRLLYAIVLIAAISIIAFFVAMGYYGYLHQTDKYLHVEIENCSNAKSLTDSELKDLPTLKNALKIAEREGKCTLKIPINEYGKIRGLSGYCINYGGKTYRVYIVTP